MRLRIMRFHADMRICGCGFPHICIYIFNMRIICISIHAVRSSINMNEHSQFVQLMFSKSLIRSGGTLELTFHMSICGFSAYMRLFCICGYPHTLCGFFYAVSCGYVHINPRKPQPHMRLWKTTTWSALISTQFWSLYTLVSDSLNSSVMLETQLLLWRV